MCTYEDGVSGLLSASLGEAIEIFATKKEVIGKISKEDKRFKVLGNKGVTRKSMKIT